MAPKVSWRCSISELNRKGRVRGLVSFGVRWIWKVVDGCPFRRVVVEDLRENWTAAIFGGVAVVVVAVFGCDDGYDM